MSTISVPLTPPLETFIDEMIRIGFGSSKADVVRRALNKCREDQAVEAVLRAQQERRDGKEIRGNLRDLLALDS